LTFRRRLVRWHVAVALGALAIAPLFAQNTLWIAARDPRVPWYAKALAGAVAAYALSPIDLIPDFVPVLGYLDDVVIVPAGILLTVRLIPDGLMDEFRAEAARREGRPTSRAGAAGIVTLWFAALALTAWWLRSRGHLGL
jgi:uncharacterized membrane protein YkvA (DUF1232 family)